MSALEQNQYEELQARLAALSRSLRLHWPEPAEARDGEAAITAYRKWRGDRAVLSLAVVSGLRLLPVLRRYGFRWALRRAGSGEFVAGDHVTGRLSVEVADLLPGEYTLDISLPAIESAPVIPGPARVDVPFRWEFPPAWMAAKAAVGKGLRPVPFEVIAPFHSPPEDAALRGTVAAELRRTANGILTLWVRLAGPAALGRLARFTIQPPPGGEPWQVPGFVGVDGEGVGEVNLSKLDDRLPGKQLAGCALHLEPLGPADLRPQDRPLLQQSLEAAIRGRDILEAAVDGLAGGEDA